MQEVEEEPQNCSSRIRSLCVHVHGSLKNVWPVLLVTTVLHHPPFQLGCQLGFTPNSAVNLELPTHTRSNVRSGYSDKYKLSPDLDHPRRRFSEERQLNITIFALLLGLGVFATVAVYISQRSLVVPSDLHLSEKYRKSWAQYSPYLPAGTYAVPSDGCVVKQVNILQRDGARYPSPRNSQRIRGALNKLQSVQEYKDSNLEFLANYTYSLGVDDLVKYGAAQSFDAGREAFKRYQHLVTNDTLAFVRAAGSPQIVLSATNWTSGFALASDSQDIPAPPFVISEEGNNTLGNSLCPNSDTTGSWRDQWLSSAAPSIARRLNQAAPGARLTTNDIASIMTLCALETVAYEHPSPFCKLFSEEEFQIFEYGADLEQYYGTGYGAELGPVRGVGYVNELIARLTHKSVSDHTQANNTLDASPSTFPNDRSIYADFTHDTRMISIFSAMGLFNQSVPLNMTIPDPGRAWVASNMIPFSGRMVTEKIECEGHYFVRIFVNDAMQPMEFCGAGMDGLCPLEQFVASQAYSRSGGAGDFEKCYA